MVDDIPDWAIERAIALGGGVAGFSNDALHAFARYIVTHEDPPVDPLVAEAEVLASRYYDNVDITVTDVALAALRCGMELAKA